MKKEIFIFVVLLATLTGCACRPLEKEEPEEVYPDFVFVEEKNPDYLGSYFIQRCNHTVWGNFCSPEWGEWKSDLELWLDPYREIPVGKWDTQGEFRAQPDYHWVVTNSSRLRLEKK